jgi:hypothetical protein
MTHIPDTEDPSGQPEAFLEDHTNIFVQWVGAYLLN